MPKIPAERLSEIGRALFVAAGTPAEEAALVMRHIVGANLVGHDSHGVIQIPTYIERIKVGHIVPGAPWVIAWWRSIPRILTPTPSTRSTGSIHLPIAPCSTFRL